MPPVNVVGSTDVTNQQQLAASFARRSAEYGTVQSPTLEYRLHNAKMLTAKMLQINSFTHFARETAQNASNGAAPISLMVIPMLVMNSVLHAELLRV